MELHQPVRIQTVFAKKCAFCGNSAIWRVGEIVACQEHAMTANKNAVQKDHNDRLWKELESIATCTKQKG